RQTLQKAIIDHHAKRGEKIQIPGERRSPDTIEYQADSVAAGQSFNGLPHFFLLPINACVGALPLDEGTFFCATCHANDQRVAVPGKLHERATDTARCGPDKDTVISATVKCGIQ